MYRLLRLFLQKSERAHAAAPPFQIEPAALDYDLVSQLRCAFIACMKIWILVALCLPAILLLFADCGLFMLFYLLLDMNFLSSFPHLRTTFGAALGVYSGGIKTSTSWQRDYRQIKVEKRRIRQKKRGIAGGRSL